MCGMYVYFVGLELYSHLPEQQLLGHSVPYDGVEDVIKEWRYNQGCSTT